MSTLLRLNKHLILDVTKCISSNDILQISKKSPNSYTMEVMNEELSHHLQYRLCRTSSLKFIHFMSAAMLITGSLHNFYKDILETKEPQEVTDYLNIHHVETGFKVRHINNFARDTSFETRHTKYVAYIGEVLGFSFGKIIINWCQEFFDNDGDSITKTNCTDPDPKFVEALGGQVFHFEMDEFLDFYTLYFLIYLPNVGSEDIIDDKQHLLASLDVYCHFKVSKSVCGRVARCKRCITYFIVLR